MNQSGQKTYIRPVDGFGLPDLIEVYRHRELLYLLTLRGISVIYRQSVLGIAWAVIRPLAMMLIIVLVFGGIFRTDPSEKGQAEMEVPYPVFVYAGLIIWGFFSNSLTNITESVVAQAGMLTKIYFPRLILPLSAMGVAALDFLVQSILLVPLLIYYQVKLQPLLLFAPLVFLLTGATALAIGTWLTALNVKFRDVKHLVPFALQLTFYLTPVIYPISFLPESLRWLVLAHPMSIVIQAFRCCTLGTEAPELIPSLVGCGILLAILISGLACFRRAEASFADLV